MELSSSVFTVAIHRPGLYAQLARDLLRVEVGMNQSQTLTFALRQHSDL
jgi:hypothetical protein